MRDGGLPVALRVGEEPAHPFELRRAYQRSAIEIGLRRTDPERREARAEPFQHLFVARALDEQAAARRAGLPGVLHDGIDDRRQRRVEIRVGEDDLRALAAQLQRHRAVPLRGCAGDRRAGRRRACERQVLDAAMQGERRAGLVTQTGDDVERALRQADARGQLGHPQQRKTGILGRLHDAGVAGGKRSADGAPEDLQRIIPRNDVAGDPVRLAPGQHRVPGGVRESSRRKACPTRRRRIRNSGRRPRRRRAPGASASRNRAPRGARARRRDRGSRARVLRAGGPFPRARGVPRRRRAHARRPGPPARRRRRRRRRWPRTAGRPTGRSSAASRRSPQGPSGCR